MEPSDLPLLLSSDLAKPGEERFPLDRIRMQKAVFLVAMRGTDRLRGLYSFEPYNWGPYSGALTSDVRRLVQTDLLEIQSLPGHQYGTYETTFVGETKAAEMWKTLEPNEQQFIRSIRQYVTSRSFSHLLREVYAEYPNFATASQFSG